MWDFLEIVSSFADVFFVLDRWRFGVCSVASIVGAGAIYWLVPAPTLAVVLCAATLVVGIGAGIVWEHRGGS